MRNAWSSCPGVTGTTFCHNAVARLFAVPGNQGSRTMPNNIWASIYTYVCRHVHTWLAATFMSLLPNNGRTPSSHLYIYLVGRSATSGQAIRKILPPHVPKVVLIGLPTRIVAAGIPHYTTINTMWSRCLSLSGRSARRVQAIYPQQFAADVPKIVLIS